MVSHGEAPYLECSSAGDSRFSAFYAKLKRGKGKSIEDLYQAAKVFADGSTGLSWRQAKGKRPVNSEEVRLMYSALWNEYIRENTHLLPVLRSASGLSDRYGKPGHACQATELWRIRISDDFQHVVKTFITEEEL